MVTPGQLCRTVTAWIVHESSIEQAQAQLVASFLKLQQHKPSSVPCCVRAKAVLMSRHPVKR